MVDELKKRFDDVFIITSDDAMDSKKKSDEFWEKYLDFCKDNDQVPFDIVKFANFLGIKVLVGDIGADISGDISYNKETDKHTIRVNKSHSTARKVFTVAHEVGHYFCDSTYLREKGEIDGKLYRMGNNNPREERANAFAAEVLMPYHEFLVIYKGKNGDIEKIASYFGVSKRATEFRAYKLGLVF